MVKAHGVKLQKIVRAKRALLHLKQFKNDLNFRAKSNAFHYVLKTRVLRVLLCDFFKLEGVGVV